jgi:hypothetical protein
VLIFFRAAPLTLSLCMLMTALHFVPSPLQRLYLTYSYGLPCFLWRDLAAAGLRGAVAALLKSLLAPLLHTSVTYLCTNLCIFMSVGCAQEVALGSGRFARLLAALWLGAHALEVALRMAPGLLGTLLERLLGPTGHCHAGDFMPSVGFSGVLFGLVHAHHLGQARAVHRLTVTGAPSLAFETAAFTLLIIAESSSFTLCVALVAAHVVLHNLAWALRSFCGREPPPERTIRWADNTWALSTALDVARAHTERCVYAGPDEFEKLCFIFRVVVLEQLRAWAPTVTSFFRAALPALLPFLAPFLCPLADACVVLIGAWIYYFSLRVHDGALAWDVAPRPASFTVDLKPRPPPAPANTFQNSGKASLFSLPLGFNFNFSSEFLIIFCTLIPFGGGPSAAAVSHMWHVSGILAAALLVPALLPPRPAATREQGLIYPGDVAVVSELPESPVNGQRVCVARVLPGGDCDVFLLGGGAATAHTVPIAHLEAAGGDGCGGGDAGALPAAEATVSGFSTSAAGTLTAPWLVWAHDDVGIELTPMTLARITLIDDLCRHAGGLAFGWSAAPARGAPP